MGIFVGLLCRQSGIPPAQAAISSVVSQIYVLYSAQAIHLFCRIARRSMHFMRVRNAKCKNARILRFGCTLKNARCSKLFRIPPLLLDNDHVVVLARGIGAVIVISLEQTSELISSSEFVPSTVVTRTHRLQSVNCVLRIVKTIGLKVN